MHILWFHFGDTLTIAKEWQWQRCGCQRLGRSEVAFEKDEVVQWRGDAVGGGLVLLLQATAVCILQRAILFHANFKRPNHSNYISIRDLFKWHHEMRRHFIFQRIPCCFLDGIWSSKTPLMFVKSTDCDKCPWSFLLQWPFWCLENKTSFSASVSLFVSFSNSINSLLDGPSASRLCISPVCFFCLFSKH